MELGFFISKELMEDSSINNAFPPAVHNAARKLLDSILFEWKRGDGSVRIQALGLSRDAAQRVMDNPPADGAGAVHHAADQGAEE